MHARSIGKLFAGTGENLFQFLPSAHQLLLLEEDDCLFVGLELSLNVRVAKLDAAALRGRIFLYLLFFLKLRRSVGGACRSPWAPGRRLSRFPHVRNANRRVKKGQRANWRRLAIVRHTAN